MRNLGRRLNIPKVRIPQPTYARHQSHRYGMPIEQCSSFDTQIDTTADARMVNQVNADWCMKIYRLDSKPNCGDVWGS